MSIPTHARQTIAATLASASSIGAATLTHSLFTEAAQAMTQSEASQISVRGADYVKIESSEDVAANWSQGPLFIKGNVGIRERDLQTLAGELRENHSNWTVVIMQSASSESFTDFTGGRHRGALAVEARVFTELPAKTAYKDIVEPRLAGVSSGAILIIVMDDRQNGLMYRAEELYDRYGLGEGNWVEGQRLVSLAQTGMRENLNVRKAVLDTVREIDKRLNTALSREINTQQQLERSVLSQSSELSEAIERFQARLAELREQYPQANGTVLYPELRVLEDRIAQSSSLIQSSDYKTALSVLETVKAELAEHTKLVDEFALAEARLRSAEEYLQRIKQESTFLPSGFYATREAELLHSSTLRDWSLGNANFAENLKRLETAVSSLPVQIAEYRSAINEISDIEKQISALRQSQYSKDFTSRFESTT